MAPQPHDGLPNNPKGYPMNLTLPDWLLIAGASWTVLACVVAVPIGRAMKHADARAADRTAAVHINWMPVLPPVPPTRSELAWLRDQPAEILAGEDLRMRFNDVINSARRAEANQ